MTKRQPPVPPENRSDKGPLSAEANDLLSQPPLPDPRKRNLDQQGRQGNIKQNTNHQGYQQNR